MMKLKKNQGLGFTLTEVLVSIVIFVLIIGAIYSAYVFHQKAYYHGQAIAETTQNAKVILERIRREIRQAIEITPQLPMDRADSSNEIIFEDGHIIETRYHYIHYFQSGDKVNREVIGYYFSGDTDENLVPWDAIPPEGETLEQKTLEQEKIIGEKVSELEFWGRGIINIAIKLEQGGYIVDFMTKVFGRNLY